MNRYLKHFKSLNPLLIHHCDRGNTTIAKYLYQYNGPNQSPIIADLYQYISGSKISLIKPVINKPNEVQRLNGYHAFLNEDDTSSQVILYRPNLKLINTYIMPGLYDNTRINIGGLAIEEIDNLRYLQDRLNDRKLTIEDFHITKAAYYHAGCSKFKDTYICKTIDYIQQTGSQSTLVFKNVPWPVYDSGPDTLNRRYEMNWYREIKTIRDTNELFTYVRFFTYRAEQSITLEIRLKSIQDEILKKDLLDHMFKIINGQKLVSLKLSFY